jgi:hypothetical protein
MRRELFNCNETPGAEVSAFGREDLGRLPRTARMEFRFAPIAWLVGVGFVGYGIDGFIGAGIGLMLPAVGVFLGALVLQGDRPGARILSKRKKTLRHRYFLWLDQQGRKLESRKQLRLERKKAEKRFLDSRRERSGQ